MTHGMAPDGLPIYELDDPEAPYGLAVMGGGYFVIRPTESATSTPEGEIDHE